MPAHWFTELRYIGRGLLRAPAFSVGVICTLAIALAAATAAFTVVDRVMLRPLPVHEPDRIVTILEDDGRGNQRLASFPTFADWRQSNRSFSHLVFLRGETASLGRPGERQPIVVALASAGVVPALGITPLLGRAFQADEEEGGGAHVAMLMESAWVSRFGRDSSIIGRVIELDDRPTTVVGVIAGAQRYPEWAEVIVPLEPLRAQFPVLQNRLLHVDSRLVGRLASGVSADQAAQELSGVQSKLAAQFADPGGAYPAVQLTGLRETILGTIGGSLRALALAMLLMLLLVGANLAGLALLRAARRRREHAVRTALGASAASLVRQVVMEWALLSAVAGAIGLALSMVLLGVIRAASLGIPRTEELHLDGRVGAVGMGLALLMGLGIALIPAVRIRRAPPGGLLVGRGSASAGTETRWLRSAVTSVQMALAVMLLAGAALMLRAFGRMQAVDIGYTPDGVFAIDVSPPKGRYGDEAGARVFFRRLIEVTAAIPGVEHAAFVNHVPLGGAIQTGVRVPGVDPDPDGADAAMYRTASEEYATVMGLRLVRGRWFTREEVEGAGTGVVISESVARRYWPDADPIGRSLTIFRSAQTRPGFGDPEPSTVLGVIRDLRAFGPSNPAVAEVYLPFTREVWGWGSVVVRSGLAPADLRRSVERALREVEPELSLSVSGRTAFRPLNDALASFYTPRRIAVLLATGLAALAMLVASLGLYALLAYAVTQRTGEFGVRMALGATPGAVRMGVLREGWRLVCVSLVLGTGGALGIGRLLASQLFETPGHDPVALGVTLGMLALVFTGALYLPAHRASTLSPTEALRSD